MTVATAHPTEVQTDESTLGCGCCVPPPDTVDRRVAELEARRQRLEHKLQALGTPARI